MERKMMQDLQPEIKILKRMQSDISFLRQKIVVIEEEIDAISGDMHEVRPEYLRKIQKIQKEGKFRSFKSVDELRKLLES